MSSDGKAGATSGLNVVIADEDSTVVEFLLRVLRGAGFKAFHAFDGLAAVELSVELRQVDLLISNTRVSGMPGVELIHALRAQRPSLPVIYIANIGRSTPELEAMLPRNIPILREPFSADELLAAVRQRLPRHAERRRNAEETPGY